MLCDRIWCAAEMDDEQLWTILDKMFGMVFNLTRDSLEYSIKQVRNDKLYFDRLKTKQADGISGRMELFYELSLFQLFDVTISWEELLSKNWIIDGISYKETLSELITNAKETLSNERLRWIGICHGDWHDMNICTSNDLEGTNFAFLDCEFAGENDVVGDAMVYLIYTSIQGDYLSPKYYPEQFTHWKTTQIEAQKYAAWKKRNLRVALVGNSIILDGVENFGTSPMRVKISRKFVETYFFPLVEYCQQKLNGEESLESRLKATLLMRLLAVYNISLMEPLDQAKVLGLLFKSIATPINNQPYQTTLSRFLEAL